MIHTSMRFERFQGRLYTSERERIEGDRGIRCYDKCMGLWARIFGFAWTIKAQGRLWVVNKKSYLSWRETRKAKVISPPLIKKEPEIHINSLHEDAIGLILKRIPLEGQIPLLMLEKGASPLKNGAVLKLLRKEPSRFFSKAQVLKLAKEQGSRLHTLDLSKLQISDEELKEISDACPNLIEMTLPSSLSTYKRDADALAPFFADFTKKGIEALPRGLASLKLRFNYYLEKDFIPSLPPRLKVLEIADVDGINDGDLARLPSTLTKVKFGGIHCSPERLKQFLLTIKSLSIRYITRGASKWDDSYMKALPKSLTRLKLFNKLHLTEEAAYDLPPYLASLSLSYRFLTPLWIKELPQTLKTLALSECDLLTDKDVEHFPRGLQTLHLFNCPRLTHQGIEALPQDLLSLTIENGEGIRDNGIEHLPRKLRSLNLTLCEHLTDACIPYLPKSLRELSLQMARELTGATFNELSPRLEKLNVFGCSRITDEAIAKLPPSIKVLSLAASQLTRAAFHRLPPKLDKLTLWESGYVQSSWLTKLPEGLRYLTLDILSDVNSEDLEHLPKSLVVLEIEVVDDQYFTKNVIERLKNRGIKRIILNGKNV